MDIKIKVQIPSLPNFVRIGGDNSMDYRIDVADLSDAYILELGNEWIAALTAHAASRRSRRQK